jgi:hypothetical protein
MQIQRNLLLVAATLLPFLAGFTQMVNGFRLAPAADNRHESGDFRQGSVQTKKLLIASGEQFTINC